MVDKILAFLVLILVVGSCTSKSNQDKDKIDSLKVDSISNLVHDEITNTYFGSIRVERIIKGLTKGDEFWDRGLTGIVYNVFANDTLLTTIDVTRKEFSGLVRQEFFEKSKFFSSDIFSVDTLNQRIVVTSVFGIPRSEDYIKILCSSDFKGNRSYLACPTECASEPKIMHGKIVNCDGVYDYSANPIYEFKKGNIMFSDLVNSRTLFFVVDQGESENAITPNAFFVDIFKKDTLDRFVFSDYVFTVAYCAMIENDTKSGVLSVLNLKQKELTTWDTLLNKRRYDLTKIESVKGLSPSANSMKMCSIDGGVIIEFDKRHRPTKWNR